MGSFGQLVLELNPTSASTVAWATFESTIRAWINATAPRVVLEVGGGRHPLLSAEDARAAGIDRYIVNDVSADELNRLAPESERSCFDIQLGPSDDADFIAECDLVFAHMVFEHVADPAGAWKTVYRLLRPGGTAISFHPTLYSPPFVANRMLPERVSRSVLERFFRSRNDDEHPKFPAYYRWCRGSSSYMATRLSSIGFSSVDVRPFYGHGYFDKIPILRSIDGRVTRVAQRRDWRWISSYAYVIAVK